LAKTKRAVNTEKSKLGPGLPNLASVLSFDKNTKEDKTKAKVLNLASINSMLKASRNETELTVTSTIKEQDQLLLQNDIRL
jgi:hypothetical protein